MAKSDKKDLGAIDCEGCGGIASIRRRSNGKQLLYLHCPNCGLDQRSGAQLQAKWAKAIAKNSQSESLAVVDEITPQQSTADQKTAGEWSPALMQNSGDLPNDNTDTNTESERIEHEQKSDSGSDGRSGNGLAVWLPFVLFGIATVVGIKISTPKPVQ
ncbi:hypothetical protein [Pseudoalteromonas luteoviolacea]|uniref:Uncharacterized protein n=1 Tax=Pseudoalteromonas luteoviolacea NCIMB 1942 TaxID=1365253 RepID=A0A162A9H2_9GAMM|nr:hypothetical protein [Pseudoalteromonas luteoviolacea]KZN46008.1 hypothetical protein N482_13110 [Pseudoalteromonas luteoviolacea NCIMB 1942]